MPKPEPRKLEPDEVRNLAFKVVNSPRNFPILATLDNPELIVYRIKPHHVRYMQEWALEYYDVAI